MVHKRYGSPLKNNSPIVHLKSIAELSAYFCPPSFCQFLGQAEKWWAEI
jgi:hypothetical protein